MRKITTDSLNWFWEKGIKPIKEKVENLKNTMDTMLKISEIVNNCVTDNPDLPLAAAQGKFLMDQITGLYSGLAPKYKDFTKSATGKYVQIDFNNDIKALKESSKAILPMLISSTSSTDVWNMVIHQFSESGFRVSSVDEVSVTTLKLRVYYWE